MATPSTPSPRVHSTTELLLISPVASSSSRPSTARKRKITPTRQESAPRKIAVLTWPEPTVSPLNTLIPNSLIHRWPAAAARPAVEPRLPYGPYLPNPLYSGPDPLTVRHIVLSFSLRDTPNKLYDKDCRDFIFKIFPGTVSLSIIEPFLLFGMTSLPSKPWPKTVAGLLPYFFVQNEADNMALPLSPVPIGLPPRSSRNIAEDLNGRDTKEWPDIFEAVRRDFEEQNIAITEVIYWWKYITIVLERRDVDFTKLPRRVGKLTCRYLFEDEMGRSEPLRARRLTDPAQGRPDESVYTTLQPGLRITSGTLSASGQEFMATTTGVLVEDRIGNRYMTAAGHGFPTECGTNVYHPNPRSRVIGELIMELDQTDIALVKLAPQEEFHNVTFENNDTPTSVQLGTLVSSRDLQMMDPVWLDSPNTGSIEGSYITSSFQRLPADDRLEREQWWIKTTWAYTGQDGDDTLPDGICGSAILVGDKDTLNVAGIFRYAPKGGQMSGYCCGVSADELINRGFTLAH